MVVVLRSAVMPIAPTPEPPYVAVIFTTERSDDNEGYDATDESMRALVEEQPGFLGAESSSNGATGLTVSYWASEEDAKAWKAVAAHRAAQELGRQKWYRAYRLRIAHVDRDYGFEGTGG